MDERNVVKFLRCPASALVDLAVEMANPTWKESLAIDLCGRKSMTQETAAEKSGYSVDAMHRWYRSGIKRLCSAWDGVWWIERLTESIQS